MRPTLVALGILAFVCTAAPLRLGAQSLEDLELKKAQAREAELKKQKKVAWTKDFGFGMLGIVETASGINADRPTVSTLLYAAPQLKYKQIYRLQLNMGFYGYYLDRDPNPWDLMDWSIQLSSLKLYTEKRSKITMSGNLRYYLPLSIESRWKESRGYARALLKLNRTVWKLYFGVELMAYYHFARWSTVNAAAKVSDHTYLTEDMMANNAQATFAERVIVSYSPIEKLTFSFMWTWMQLMDYQPGSAYDGVGSTFLADVERKNDLWDHAFSAIFDVTWNVWKWFYLAGGYSVMAPVHQNMGKKVSWNPFDPLYGQVYLDLMVIY